MFPKHGQAVNSKRLNLHVVVSPKCALIADLLYAPISRHAKGSLMDYVEKLDALDAAEAAINTAIANLSKAADALARGGWKKLDVPGRPTGGVVYMPPIDSPPNITPWLSFDEIKKLAEAYWSALAEAEDAWKSLSPAAQRHMRAPEKPPLS